MGFNWLFVNPVQYPGFSGSLYAVKEHYRVNPDFLAPGASDDGIATLRDMLGQIRALGLRPIMDLVINHTAKDCPLADEHPEWYVRDQRDELVSPSVEDPADTRRRTVWGDLAEIDNNGSSDRRGLWDYWAELVRNALRWGFAGFRCDAAYKVPGELWRHLIAAAREVDPEVRFFAETLGCKLDEVHGLADAGLDFFFNSSKWWAFDQPWCLEQHEAFRHYAQSIAFPESHDTPRLAAETGGNEAVQRGRYAFAAAFSSGVLMPIGYEFGFRRPLDVVRTRPEDWETPAFDLTAFVGRVNRLKLACSLLQGEGPIDAVTPLETQTLLLRRGQAPESQDNARPPREQQGWIVINKNWWEPAAIRLDGILPGEVFRQTNGEASYRLLYVCRDDEQKPRPAPIPRQLPLRPAEVALVLPAG